MPGTYNLKIPSVATLLVCLLAGCVTIPKEKPELSGKPTTAGVYHKLKRGQTLWRIAKTYNVPITNIIEYNSIPDVAKLEENQLIFIPGATSVKEIIIDKDNNQKDFGWPLNGKILNYFRERKGAGISQGIDIQGQEGEIVKAARSGSVVFADYLPGFGYTVILNHDDGYYTVYANNADLSVKLKDIVSKNMPISRVGSRGDVAYLHFEVRKRGMSDNPLYYLP